jgi:tetratricopeptide (TPR) repeat protein
MSSERLTRKEIKQQDRFAESMGTALDYVQVNRRLIFAVLGGIVLLAAFVFGVFAWLDYRTREANRLLARGIQLAQAPIAEAAAKPDDPTEPSFATEAARQEAAKGVFGEVRERFGASQAADAAALYLAQIAMREGRADEARALWQEYLEEHPDTLPAAGVRVSLFSLDRAQGKADEVERELRRLLETPEKEAPDDVLLHQLALTQEAQGKSADAQLTYRRLIDEHPSSPFAGEARLKSGGTVGSMPMSLPGS